MRNIYEITEQFEQELCRYTGAPLAVALDSCSNAIFLSLKYEGVAGQVILIPSHTYVSVPCEIIRAGAKVGFIPAECGIDTLKGAYQLEPTRVWDSSLRFDHGMYIPGSFMCLSFTGPYKHLKLSKGGAILTDDKKAYEWFKKMRASGRNEMGSPNETEYDMIGYNMYLLPEIAARGLLLINQFYDRYGNSIHTEDVERPYPDLSKFEIFKKGTI